MLPDAFTGLLAFVFLFVILVASSPITTVSSSPHIAARATQAKDVYVLRANCPTCPYHNRYLVMLPTTHHLGFENFTHHPETRPVQLVPVSLSDGLSALRLATDENIWLAALDLGLGTRTLSLSLVKGEKPEAPWDVQNGIEEREMFEECPLGYECITDQWVLTGPNDEGDYENLRYAGFGGAWVSIKDAPSGEGWHVYWKGNGGFRLINFDLVHSPFALVV